MESIVFYVQGSANKPYKVLFVRRSETNLSAYCTCPAGEKGQYCKHRFNILKGKKRKIVSKNAKKVSVVQAWLPGTDVEAAIQMMREAKEEVARTKKVLAGARKDVARAMRD